MRGNPHCTMYSYADRSTLYIYTCNARFFCRIRSASRLSRPRAGYPRSEGSGSLLRNSYSCRVLRAELEDIQTQLRHHSLHVSVEFLAAHWR